MKSVSYKKKETLTVCLALGVVAGGVLSASAQRQQDRSTERTTIEQQEQPGQPPRQAGQRPGRNIDTQQAGRLPGTPLRQEKAMQRASKLLDMEIHVQDGPKLGDVEELILSQDRRSVEHVKVSLDDGGSVNLSLDELSVKHDDDNVLLVRTSKQALQLRQARDQAWVGSDQDEQVSRRVSKLIGFDLQGTDGNDVGSINDLIIDTQNSRIMTAAVKTGGFLGFRTRLASVEWQQVNFADDGDTASINMTKDHLSDRAHRHGAYWDRHAFEGVEGQRERGLQQPGQRQRTPGVEGHQQTEVKSTTTDIN